MNSLDMTMASVACIGECMVELRQAQGGQSGGLYSRGFGGDTLNTAVYLARLDVNVDYLTALGDDALSDEMIAACRAAGVPLWVGYYRRALPRFLAVRDLVASGAIGDVRMVISRQFQRLPAADQFARGNVPWRVNPELSGGGFFFA